eukprot:CAMPEP_0194267078 /NCGR_PEP_ID=MMETSP0169-20130528/1740_1 /TAXON_ID=218684 /ORGANISM="Corethron pennatum, Strain L29A3" /LENGTH=347 /DNA_ID=CAMNT_0039007881 /DNA_START=154 /DNA_END=1197 /DNA_ORIENTATION=-
MAPFSSIVLIVLCAFSNSSLSYGQKISKRDSYNEDDTANRLFVNRIFNAEITAQNNASPTNVVMSPAGIYFAASTADQLIKLPVRKYWSAVTSSFDIVAFQKELKERQPQIYSRAAVAGENWSARVPSGFVMPNFRVFETVDVSKLEKFTKVSLDELASALDVIVHALKFAGSWRTPFEKSRQVKFSDGKQYNFMEAFVPYASWFESKYLKMITIPFESDENTGGDDIVIDFIVSKGASNDVNLARHWSWVGQSETRRKTIIAIPKVKINFKTSLDLFPDNSIKSVQKVAMEWDEKGARGEAVTMIMSRDATLPSLFVIDRPFYFVIRIGKMWLFAGYVAKIDEEIN